MSWLVRRELDGFVGSSLPAQEARDHRSRRGSNISNRDTFNETSGHFLTVLVETKLDRDFLSNARGFDSPGVRVEVFSGKILNPKLLRIFCNEKSGHFKLKHDCFFTLIESFCAQTCKHNAVTHRNVHYRHSFWCLGWFHSAINAEKTTCCISLSACCIQNQRLFKLRAECDLVINTPLCFYAAFKVTDESSAL